jgi:ribosomal protein S16
VQFWIGKGAQPSVSVRTLIARHLTPAAPVAVDATAPAEAK